MDITKRFNRVVQLFFMLQSKAVVTIEELEQKFEISRRTIYRDLKALESAGIPVSYELNKGYSIMEGFRLQPSRFSQAEILSLTIAEKMMKKHETDFVKKHFEAALLKIKSSFQFHQKSELIKIEEKLYVNENLKLNEYLPNIIDVLLNSTVNKKIISISYLKAGDAQPDTRKAEPVGLFYEDSFWYVFAYCHLRKAYRNFRLDRIKQATLLDEYFEVEHLPINQLRSNSIPDVVTKIIITVDRKFAHYLYWERQSFGYQKEEMLENYVTMYFDCEVHPTSFVRWFLKFFDIGEIVSPNHLKTELKEIVNAGWQRLNTKAAIATHK